MRAWLGVPVAVICLAGAAHAEDFDARLAKGHTAMETTEGKAYVAATEPLVRAAIVACLPPGEMEKIDMNLFIGQCNFVANVADSGALTAVDYQPDAPLAKCFAEHMGKAHFPKPPSPDFPISIEMNVKP